MYSPRNEAGAPNSALDDDVQGDAVGRRIALHEADDHGHAGRGGRVGELLGLRGGRRRRLFDEGRQAARHGRRWRPRNARRAPPRPRGRRDRRARARSRQSRKRFSGATPKRSPVALRRLSSTSHSAAMRASNRVNCGSSISLACVPQPIQPMRRALMPGSSQNRARRAGPRRWPSARGLRHAPARAIARAARRAAGRRAGTARA